MIQSLTVIRQMSGLQELGGERAVGVPVGLRVARLSALPVAGPERSLLGGARRDPPPPSLDDEHRQLHEPRQGNHDDTRAKRRNEPKQNRAGPSVPGVYRNPSRIQRLSSGSSPRVRSLSRRLIISKLAGCVGPARFSAGGAVMHLVHPGEWFRPSVTPEHPVSRSITVQFVQLYHRCVRASVC